MTQEDYKLWTGEAAPFDDSDWARIVNMAQARLASFLCLEKFPMCPDEMDDQLQMLLANFVCAILHFQGNPEAQVSSKSVRNFTISFTGNNVANAFAQVAVNYKDIVERFSACGDGFDVEKSRDCYCI